MIPLKKYAHSYWPGYRVTAAIFCIALSLSLMVPQTILAANIWTDTGFLTIGCYDHTATRLANGKVLVAGGWNGTIDLDSAEIYDPGTETWSTTGNLKVGRDSHTATLLNNGKVLVVGGWDTYGNALDSAEIYTPKAASLPWLVLLFQDD
jgi:hypothetical protein